MKKILSLIIVAILSLSFIACSSNYRGNLLHYTNDTIKIQDYFEEVLGTKSSLTSDDFSYSFSFKQTDYFKTVEEKTNVVKKVNGVVNYDDGMLLDELKIDGKSSAKIIVPTIDGKEKATTKVSEKSVFFFQSGLLDKAYVLQKTNMKSKSTSSKTEEKTMDESLSFAFTTFTGYLSLRAITNKVEAFLTAFFSGSATCFVYLNNGNMTLVESHSENQTVIKIFSDGDELSKIVVEEKISAKSQTNFTTRKYSIKICDDVEIKKPKDKKDYEKNFYEEELA